MGALKYKTTVVDPPWDYGGKKAKKPLSKEYGWDVSRWSQERHHLTQSPTNDYDGEMSVEEIKLFNLPSKLADDSCMLFLWITNRYLFECKSIIKSWGFNIGNRGSTMAWKKVGRAGKVGRLASQATNSWESNLEFVVVAKEGDIKWESTKGLKSGFDAPNEGHFVKPARRDAEKNFGEKD